MGKGVTINRPPRTAEWLSSVQKHLHRVASERKCKVPVEPGSRWKTRELGKNVVLKQNLEPD